MIAYQTFGAPLLVSMSLVTATEMKDTTDMRPVVVVDDGAEGFAAEGHWSLSTRDPGFYGDGYRWHPRGIGRNKATWRARVPKPGFYNVYARWVMSTPADRATNAPFCVKSSRGKETVRVNMAVRQSAAEYPAGRAASPWNLLGTFPFRETATVVLTDDADNSVVGDAVRLEYMESLDAVAPKPGQLLFHHDCSSMHNWSIEGSKGHAEIVGGKLRVTSTDHKRGVHAWFRPDLPDNVRIEYDMTVHDRHGFALVFFCAHGAGGEDILEDLPPRDGVFDEYVRNDRLRCYHLSVHRRGVTEWVDGANLNKNPGKTLLQRHAIDPCPPSDEDRTWHMTIIKMGARIQLLVDERPVLFYLDDADEAYGGGKFGFRQIYHSEISYDNLRVYEAMRAER